MPGEDFNPPAAMITARITITRYLDENGRDLVHVDSDDLGGGRIAVVEALGMLSLAEYDVMHHPEDDDD